MYYLTILLLLGKERESDTERGLAHKVVMSLVQGLEGKGYHVFTDNFCLPTIPVL